MRFSTVFLALLAGCAAPPKPPAIPPHSLPPLEVPGKEYRTPRAGEGFRTEVLGEEIAVQPRDRRSVTAWDLGGAFVAPGLSEAEALPFASLFFWRRPDEDTFVRAVVVGVYNEVIAAKSGQPFRPFEGIFTLNSYTVPVDQAEYVDGKRIDEEELLWGRVHPGLGFGYREDLDEPGQTDNMLAVSLLAEPGALYFEEGSDTAKNFIAPRDTLEGRGHFQVRLDALERNLLELPHRGIAMGSDLVYGHRARWSDWGIDGKESAETGRDFVAFSGYMIGAGGIPFVSGDRHRILGSIHGGAGDSVDRFSAFRIGGGPTGDEYEALARPVLPGALIEEFATSHYGIAVGEYRYEPIFFVYLSLRTSVSFVERDRNLGRETSDRDDFLYSIGGRLTSGFFLNTRLQLDYNYNTGVLRRGEFGGHEVVVHISGSF